MITEKDNIVTSNPIKNNPVLYVKNEIINVPNKQISINEINKAKHNKKNFIIQIIILNNPFINLYSLCFGSRIIILFSFF